MVATRDPHDRSYLVAALQAVHRGAFGAEAERFTLDDLARMSAAVATDRLNPHVQFFAKFCDAFLRAFKNLDYRHQTNGEAWLLSRLAAFDVRTIFDVGANVGTWSRLAADVMPHATIHAFEIVPSVRRALKDNLAELGPRLKIAEHGLADHDGVVTVRFNPDDTGQTTATEYGIGPCETIDCPVRAGDAYLEDAGVGSIDLLKIDVEGAEPVVLQGLSRAFDRGAITVAQFEYGFVNIYTKFLLKDFHEFFSNRGFVLGKLYPDGVAFQPYRVQDEDFMGPNYVCCRQDRPDLIDALRGAFR